MIRLTARWHRDEGHEGGTSKRRSHHFPRHLLRGTCPRPRPSTPLPLRLLVVVLGGRIDGEGGHGEGVALARTELFFRERQRDRKGDQGEGVRKGASPSEKRYQKATHLALLAAALEDVVDVVAAEGRRAGGSGVLPGERSQE